jgi:hypothetical protein
MANVINSVLFDRLYAIAFKAFRQKLSIIKTVTRYDTPQDAERSYARGNVIIAPIPALFADSTVTDVVPGPTPPAGNDITLRYAQINLDYYKKVDYHFTDQELVYLQEGTLSNQLDAAVDALAGAIARTVWLNHTSAYNVIGTIGTPILVSDVSVLQTSHAILSEAGVPNDNRNFLMSPVAYANALGLPVFQQYLQYGAREGLIEAQIPRALGFNWWEDNYLPSFVGGTLSNGTSKAALINNASVAVGDTTVPIDSATLTGTLKVGDVFTVAGDTQQYVITADVTASGNAATISFTPAAKVAWANNAVVTFIADYDISGVAMSNQAIAFASRRTDNVYAGGSMLSNMFDPVSGLSLCMEVTRQYMRTNITLSCLWGSTLARPEAFVKIIS